MFNRRTFLKTTATALPMASALDILEPGFALSAEAVATAAVSGDTPNLISLPQRLTPVDLASEPWQQKIRRVGQSNMTEHDPAVDERRGVGRLLALGPRGHRLRQCNWHPRVLSLEGEFHRQGKFLNGRDFFGECVAAAKKRGMRVVARMSPDLNWGDALEAHPEWAMRYKDGSVQFSSEEPRLFKTCMFSAYMDDYVPAIMREINSLYDVDCFYTNGWPPIGSLPECHCAICSKLPPTDTPAYWRVFNDRVFELWQQYDAIAKEKKPDSFYFANSAATCMAAPIWTGLAKSLPGSKPTTKAVPTTIPPCGDAVCRVASAMPCMDGKFAANVTAAYSTGIAGWRNASKNPAEAKMWLNETLASGMAPYYHFIGAEAGLG